MERAPDKEWVTDNIHLILVGLLIILILLAATLVVGAYSVTHAPRSDVTAVANELRERINLDLADQHTVNSNFSNELVGVENAQDEIETEIERIEKLQHMRPHRFAHRK